MANNKTVIKSVRKNIKPIRYWNINGKPLRMALNINNNNCLSLSIFSENEKSLMWNILMLTLVALLNLYLIYFEIARIQICSMIFAVSLVWLFCILTTTKEENIVAVKNLGIQITTINIINKKTVFIPYEHVKDVFINEVIFRHKVVYLLTLITKDTSNNIRLVPLFIDIMPRLKCLQDIYRSLKTLLQKEDSNEINKDLREAILRKNT